MADKVSWIKGDPNSPYFWVYFAEKLPGTANQTPYYVLTSHILTEKPQVTQVICQRNLDEEGLFTDNGSFTEAAASEFLDSELELGGALHFFAKLSKDGQSIRCRRSNFP